MAGFRNIDRQLIIVRRADADSCLHYGLHHSATLTACSAIELLLEFLVSELYGELSQSRGGKAQTLANDVEKEERRENAKVQYWGLKTWVNFYRRHKILCRLQAQFDFHFDQLNLSSLKDANEIWNKCKHDPYLAAPDTAGSTGYLLDAYLDEARVKTDEVQSRQVSVGQMSAHWLGRWELPLIEWAAANPDSPQSNILIYLVPMLDLVVRLIDDERVDYRLKSPLIVAANYVFSSIDLVPESSGSGEVNALVDDGAVLALSLCWLTRQNDFDHTIVNSHWTGGASFISECHDLKRHICNCHEVLFPDSRGQLGSRLVWKVIERIAIDGPEALWQNYWKEQSHS